MHAVPPAIAPHIKRTPGVSLYSKLFTKIFLDPSYAAKLIAEYGNRCNTEVKFPFQNDSIPSSFAIRLTTLKSDSDGEYCAGIDGEIPGTDAANIGLTWYNIVKRESGAVTVLPTEPAIPPAIIVFTCCVKYFSRDEDFEEDGISDFQTVQILLFVDAKETILTPLS